MDFGAFCTKFKVKNLTRRTNERDERTYNTNKRKIRKKLKYIGISQENHCKLIFAVSTIQHACMHTTRIQLALNKFYFVKLCDFSIFSRYYLSKKIYKILYLFPRDASPATLYFP